MLSIDGHVAGSDETRLHAGSSGRVYIGFILYDQSQPSHDNCDSVHSCSHNFAIFFR